MARGYVREVKGNWYILIIENNGKQIQRSVAKELGKKVVTEKDAQKLLRRKFFPIFSHI